MPTSRLNLAPIIVAHVFEVANELDRPITILDVGPGFGRYGLLIRELIDGIERGTRIGRLDAIEAEERYLAAFPWLTDIYDDVFNQDAADPALLGPTGGFFEHYDIVLMLDVIEHLEHDAALELLDTIPGYVVISTPRDFFDNPQADQGWETERHRSHWPDPALFGPRVDRFDVDAYNVFGSVVVRLGPK